MGAVDVTHIDFSNSVTIGPGYVELYEKGREPPAGEGLNRMFNVTYYKSDLMEGIKRELGRGIAPEEVFEKVQGRLQEKGVTLVHVDFVHDTVSLAVEPVVNEVEEEGEGR